MASFLWLWCFGLVTFIIPQIVTPLLPFPRAAPPWGRSFFLRFSLLFASVLHLETLPFRFDSLNCTTSLHLPLPQMRRILV